MTKLPEMMTIAVEFEDRGSFDVLVDLVERVAVIRESAIAQRSQLIESLLQYIESLPDQSEIVIRRDERRR